MIAMFPTRTMTTCPKSESRFTVVTLAAEQAEVKGKGKAKADAKSELKSNLRSRGGKTGEW